jgi:hypothetical protein
LVPPELDGVTSGDEFVSRLPAFDSQYESLREEAKKSGSVLRYVGVIDVKAKVIKASLERHVPFMFDSGGVVLKHCAGIQPHTPSLRHWEVQTTYSLSTLKGMAHGHY